MSGNSASHLGASRRRSFDPVRLEQELNELWNDLTEDNHQVSRACLSNLVIAMPEEYDVSQLVADITERHPSRVLVVRQCKRLNPGQLEAFVSASCSKRSEGTVVCCESITLDYGVGGERALPNAIRSLFVGTQARVLVIKQLAWSDLGWVEELG
ncbi:MAG: hypothetical protein HKN21_11285, partial [Candidatus Eisenbacteria bacterium]|nr:hypothetical protein [Candidatus Eisenbacteria bacterium]